MGRPYTASSTSRTDGFTLVEVLVALLVFSIGILGLAALQITGLRETQMARMRTQAVLIAYDMADRIRANNSAASVTPPSAYVLAIDTAPPAAAKDCSATTCTDGEMAAYDLDEWYDSAQRLLPNGGSQISNTATGVYRITVMWDEERTGANGTGCDPNDSNDRRCYQLDVTL